MFIWKFHGNLQNYKNLRGSMKSFHNTVEVPFKPPFNPPLWKGGVVSSAVKARVYNLVVRSEGERVHGFSRKPTLALKTRGDGTADVMGQDSAS